MTRKYNALRIAGFTLLEILVAMTILAIIILIVSGVFRQSTTAWESGTRKTELNMEGRAAVDLMAQELSRAVADPAVYKGGAFAAQQVKFWTLGIASNGARVAQRITYWQTFSCIKRKCETVDPAAGSYPAILNSEEATLADNVRPNTLTFTYPPDFPLGSATNLPAWVDIELSLDKLGENSTIKAWSSGPDPVSASDDIRSWDSAL